jgi:hypothetical protein
MIRLMTSIAALALALAGCAGPRLQVTSRGAMPPGGTYRFTQDDQSQAAQTLVATALATNHFGQASDPDYLVQISSFSRPLLVGVAVPKAGETTWLRPPVSHSRKSVGGLTIILTSIRDGREVYRASVQRRARQGAIRLADLVAAVIPRDQSSPQPK